MLYIPFQKVLKNQQYKNKSPEVWVEWVILLDFILNGPDDLWSLKEKSDQIEKDLLSDDNISQLEVNWIFSNYYIYRTR